MGAPAPAGPLPPEAGLSPLLDLARRAVGGAKARVGVVECRGERGLLHRHARRSERLRYEERQLRGRKEVRTECWR